MATPQQIRDACDTKLSALQSAITTRQTNYAAAHGGRFWQGLLTHAVTPADGTELPPTVGVICPSDQQGAPWPNAILTSTLPMALRVDCYEGPGGLGYTATLIVKIGARVFTRTFNVGPEAGRAQGWADRTPMVF